MQVIMARLEDFEQELRFPNAGDVMGQLQGSM